MAHDLPPVPEKIREVFRSYFATWDIELPDPLPERVGAIQEQGWLIQYLWNRDAEPFLDVYAAHRFTDDRHFRVRSDGRTEDLPAIRSVMPYPDDPVERAEVERQYDEHNQMVAKGLVEKGFTRFTLNMVLRSMPSDDGGLAVDINPPRALSPRRPDAT